MAVKLSRVQKRDLLGHENKGQYSIQNLIIDQMKDI